MLSYVSNNCMAGLIHNHFKEEYKNGFIYNLILDDFQYVLLCKDLNKYMDEDLNECKINLNSKWALTTKKQSFNDWDYPITDLSGIEIHWIHHLNYDVVINKWLRRTDRWLTNNSKTILLLNYFTFFQDHTHDQLQEMFEIFNKHEHFGIIIIPKDTPADLVDIFDINKNKIIKMDKSYNKPSRNKWNYNLQDTPDVRETFIKAIEELR